MFIILPVTKAASAGDGRVLDLLEAGNVLYSSCSDVFQSLARKESVVTANDHIWKAE
jgi:hypothetical protein